MSFLPPESYDAVVFDLGGVILNLTYGATTSALSRLYGADASVHYDRLAQRELFDLFERGEITPEAFRSGLGELFGSRGATPTSDEIDDAWNALLDDIPEGRLLLLARLRREKRVFLLSNTNVLHLERFARDYAARHEARHGPWASLFEAAHYSHELGMRKPEARIYAHLTELHGLDPSRTLFIDDNPDNVAAARAFGWRALHHPSNSDPGVYFEEAPASPPAAHRGAARPTAEG